MTGTEFSPGQNLVDHIQDFSLVIEFLNECTGTSAQDTLGQGDVTGTGNHDDFGVRVVVHDFLQDLFTRLDVHHVVQSDQLGSKRFVAAQGFLALPDIANDLVSSPLKKFRQTEKGEFGIFND